MLMMSYRNARVCCLWFWCFVALSRHASSAITPAYLSGGSFGADIVSYLCNLTISGGTPSWLVGLRMEPFVSNCSLALEKSSQDALVEAVVDGSADFASGVSYSDARSQLVDFIRPFYFSEDDVPVGVVVAKDASARLSDSIQAGIVSTLWSGNSSVMFQVAGPGSTNLVYPSTAITGFLTNNGMQLSYANGPTPINEGSLEVPSEDDPVPVTIAVYRGNTLPLASIKGDSIDTWEGIEVEMIKALCATPGPLRCNPNILIANTVDERLSLLDDAADISIGSIVVTQSRLDNYSFVQPFYFSAGPALYVTQENAPSYPENATLDVMRGEPVCTVTGSAQNPAGEQYGAVLIEYQTRDEAVAGVMNGTCIGLLWVSHVSFEDLSEVASDPMLNDPIGIAVSIRLPISAYSYLSALSAQWMAEGRESPLLQWEAAFQGEATANAELAGVVNAITSFVPPRASSSAEVLSLLSLSLSVSVCGLLLY